MELYFVKYHENKICFQKKRKYIVNESNELPRCRAHARIGDSVCGGRLAQLDRTRTERRARNIFAMQNIALGN